MNAHPISDLPRHRARADADRVRRRLRRRTGGGVERDITGSDIALLWNASTGLRWEVLSDGTADTAGDGDSTDAGNVSVPSRAFEADTSLRRSSPDQSLS